MICWIASYPRSGNRFCRRYVLGESLGFKISEVTRKENNRSNLEALLHDPETAASNEPLFVKTHCLPNESSLPAVYLVRDGRDAIVSQTYFVYEVFDKIQAPVATAEFFQRMRHLILRSRPFGTWSQNVEAWTNRPNTAVVMFEDLIRDPARVMCSALESLEFKIPKNAERKIPTFEELHAENPRIFRKGKIGTWRTEMPADLQQLFWEHHGLVASKFGFKP